MARLPFSVTVTALGLICPLGCYSGAPEPATPTYRNPLDFLDGGTPRPPDGGSSRSSGTVDGLSPDLFSATYFVTIDDAGIGTTQVLVSDVADLCAALAQDGGLGAIWSLVRFHADGDAPGNYTVAPILPPSGATAEFDYQSDGGGFGATAAMSGTLQLDSVDPGNVQPALGTYTLTFEGTDALTGSFVAFPCAVAPPIPTG